MSVESGRLGRLKRVLVDFLINLGAEELVNSIADRIVNAIRDSSPEEIWNYAVNNVSLLKLALSDPEVKSEVDSLIAFVKYKGLRDKALEVVDSVDAKTVLKALIARTVDNKKVFPKVYYIVSSPTLVRWVDNNVREMREYFKKRLSES